jgi:hypothetical protein
LRAKVNAELAAMTLSLLHAPEPGGIDLFRHGVRILLNCSAVFPTAFFSASRFSSRQKRLIAFC